VAGHLQHIGGLAAIQNRDMTVREKWLLQNHMVENDK